MLISGLKRIINYFNIMEEYLKDKFGGRDNVVLVTYSGKTKEGG